VNKSQNINRLKNIDLRSINFLLIGDILNHHKIFSTKKILNFLFFILMICMLKAVFFDMGGTILHGRDIPGINEKSFENVNKTLQKYGYSIKVKELSEAYEKAKEIIKNMTPEFIELELIDRWKETLKILGVKQYDIIANECMDAFFRVRQGIGIVVYYDDFKPTIIQLRKMGLKLGLISNVDYSVMYFIDELKLRDYFDILIFSWKVKWKKPHPKIFEIATTKLKVKPEESIMVGDSLRADVGGANGIGMTSVWINRMNNDIDLQDLEPRPDYVIKNLMELIPIVDKLRK